LSSFSRTRIAVDADALRQVQHHCHRQHVVGPGERDERTAGLGLHVRRVDDGEVAAVEPLAGDVVEHVESGRGGGLVVLVAGDESSAEVA
jgi:hypothetical protein